VLNPRLIALQGIGFTPIAIAVQGLIEYIEGGGTTTFSQEVEITIPRKKWYVKRKKHIHIFDSAEEADSWQEAATKAEEAIEQAQKTSRRARKRLKDKVYAAVKEPESIPLDLLGKLVDRYSIPVDLPKLIEAQNLELIAAIYLLAMHKQDEEEIELLLLA
jgi:hypothetical protein